MNLEPHTPGLWCKGWFLRLLLTGLLLLGAGGVYFRALNRVFLADQMYYFLELNGDTSLAAGLQLADYGAHRQYYKGDELSYRPLLFAGLALENTLFQRDFRKWNLANLLIHLLVCWLLFEVLWGMTRSPVALGAAGCFALLASNFELVTWNHLGGYMAGYGLLLAAWWAAWNMRTEGGRRWFWLYGLAMTGAMLEHEIGVAASLGGILYGAACCGWKMNRWHWRWRLALFLPVLLYAVLYAQHVTQCQRLFWIDAATGSWLSRVVLLPELFMTWCRHSLLPHSGQITMGALQRSIWVPSSGGGTLPTLVAGGLWLGLAACLVHGFSTAHWRKIRLFSVGLGFLIIVYAGLVLTGRPAYALTVPYYAYFPALLGMVGICTAVDWSRAGRRIEAVALACLLLLAALNGRLVYQYSVQIQEVNQLLAHDLERVEQAVRPRLADPGYTFVLRSLPVELDLASPATRGYPGENAATPTPLLRFLYGRHYDTGNAPEPLEIPGLDTPGAAPGGIFPGRD